MVETFAVSVSVLAVISECILGLILDAIPVAGREGSLSPPNGVSRVDRTPLLSLERVGRAPSALEPGSSRPRDHGHP